MVKRLNFKELKNILVGYKDEDLERISICLPCGTENGSDGGALGWSLIFQIQDEEWDSNMINLLETDGFNRIKKHLIEKLNSDFDFRNKLINEKVDDDEYEDLECDW